MNSSKTEGNLLLYILWDSLRIFFNTITSIKTKLEFEIWHVGFLCIKKKREGGKGKRKTLCTKHSLSLTLPVPSIDDYKIAKLIGP